jgi:hypothetical protein
MRRTLPALFLIAILSISATAQDAALRDRVDQLVARLADVEADAAARDAAEQALVRLGPRVLPLLPEPAAVTDADAILRLDRVRAALAADLDEETPTASLVTIQGKGVRLTEALQQLQKQSSNVVVDLRTQFGGEATNPRMDLDIEEKPFFEALDTISRAAGLGLTFFTGDGSIGLMDADMTMPNVAPDMPRPAAVEPRVVYTGPFRVQLRQILLSRDFQTGLSRANAQMEVAWEPRLRPMLLALRSSDVAITDDQGRAVEPALSEESTSTVIRPENPAAELNLNLAAPERSASRLAKLRVRADVTLPAGVQTVRFASLTTPESKTQGGVTVKLESTEVEEQVWKVRVRVAFRGEGPAFESYQQGLFNNRVWLQTRDGARIDLNGPNGGGFNSLGSDPGNVGFEYLFVDVPGKPADYGLGYETPSRVATIPLTFEFTDVPLP